MSARELFTRILILNETCDWLLAHNIPPNHEPITKLPKTFNHKLTMQVDDKPPPRFSPPETIAPSQSHHNFVASINPATQTPCLPPDP